MPPVGPPELVVGDRDDALDFAVVRHPALVDALLRHLLKLIDIETDAPKDKLIELLKHAEDGCYASDVVRNPTPLRAHLTVNGEEAYVHESGGKIPDLPAGPAFGDNPTGMSGAEIAAAKKRGGGGRPDA